MKYKFLSHTADIKFQAYGKTIEEVFKNCAEAVLKCMTEEKVIKKRKITFNALGNDLESLLYNFIEEFLFLIDSENFLISEIIKLGFDRKNFKIIAEVMGDDAKGYNVEHIKAVTYNEMFVKQIDGKWIAQVVLDV